MTQVFTKKHKKSSCPALLVLFLALTGPSFAQEPAKELSETSNHLLNIDKKSEMLGLPVGLFGVYHQRQPAHLKAKNDAQLRILDSLAFYVRPSLNLDWKGFLNLSKSSKSKTTPGNWALKWTLSIILSGRRWTVAGKIQEHPERRL